MLTCHCAFTSMTLCLGLYDELLISIWRPSESLPNIPLWPRSTLQFGHFTLDFLISLREANHSWGSLRIQRGIKRLLVFRDFNQVQRLDARRCNRIRIISAWCSFQLFKTNICATQYMFNRILIFICCAAYLGHLKLKKETAMVTIYRQSFYWLDPTSVDVGNQVGPPPLSAW